MTPKVSIVRTGVANTASVIACFERLGASAELTVCADDVRSAAALVLPGVGTFAAALAAIREQGLEEPLNQRITAGLPLLAVCAGFQALFNSSEESPGVVGLGILPGKVVRFGEGVSVPQFGWNRVEQDSRPGKVGSLRTGYAYFANSYAVIGQTSIDSLPEDLSVSTSFHGDKFVAAVQRGTLLGCQFHPELSGAWGESLIKSWLAQANAEG